MYPYLTLNTQCLFKNQQISSWSYFNMKLAANKDPMAALSCGKQLLRDSNGTELKDIILRKSVSVSIPPPPKWDVYILILQKWNNSVLYILTEKKNMIPIKKEWRYFCSEWICSSAVPAASLPHTPVKICRQFKITSTYSTVPCHIKDFVHFSISTF